MAVVLSTKDKAIVEARALLQSYGFNGFSFQHVADRLGIKKPSLYVHFESKEALGLDLIETYFKEFKNWSETIAIFDPSSKVGALFEMFFNFSKDAHMLCPCSALSGDFNSLSKPMQKALNASIKYQRDWLESVIKEGQKSKDFRKDLSAKALSQTILATAYGSQTLARVSQSAPDIREAKTAALALLKA